MVRDGLQRRFSAIAAIGSALFLSLALLSGGGVQAQGEEGGHPAHIHSGSCDTLGDVIYPLSNVGPGMVTDGTPEAGGDTVGATEDIYPVDVSVTTVDAKLSDITNGDTAVNVHESADKIQNYIACGNIGGTMFGDSLTIGLETLNDSGYSGVAVLTADGDKTQVTIYLGEGLSGGDEGASEEESTPAASSDTSGEAAAGESAVEIANFAFSPDSVEVAAGSTVTWTNNDSTAHTVTADDGSFDSGNLDSGATFSQKFDTPGTYTYHCAIHPNMTGTITVK